MFSLKVFDTKLPNCIKFFVAWQLYFIGSSLRRTLDLKNRKRPAVTCLLVFIGNGKEKIQSKKIRLAALLQSP
jgi:hypothetical protein